MQSCRPYREARTPRERRGARQSPGKRLSEIAGAKPGLLRDPCEHLGTDLLFGVKGERVEGPSSTLQALVRAFLRCDMPADAEQRDQYMTGLDCPPLAHPQEVTVNRTRM